MKRDLKASDLSSISWMDRLVAAATEDLVPLETPADPEGPATAGRNRGTFRMMQIGSTHCTALHSFQSYSPDLLSSPFSCELWPGSSASVSPARKNHIRFQSIASALDSCQQTSGKLNSRRWLEQTHTTNKGCCIRLRSCFV